ncbi:hypothetical protein EVAR_23670_1 [Eumeta japonica]|uniref:Uncharacterized protein n=1 Tax=Eumeta variegata TaxID=151549 RepID=A0A4C1VKR7_EUMVA|nr:hypothetical protein EVAR_23670_1 [Eumeta japonica]
MDFASPRFRYDIALKTFKNLANGSKHIGELDQTICDRQVLRGPRVRRSVGGVKPCLERDSFARTISRGEARRGGANDADMLPSALHRGHQSSILCVGGRINYVYAVVGVVYSVRVQTTSPRPNAFLTKNDALAARRGRRRETRCGALSG